MDILLGKVTQQAMNYAIRSGITITASYAIHQSSRLLKTVEEGHEKEELQSLQEKLESKIRIISPAIDMIELISARGNSSLESAVSLTQLLRWEIQSLGQRLAAAANREDLARKGNSKAKSSVQLDLELKSILKQIKKLLVQIDDAVPLINLAITTSGASLSTTLPSTISPSRLLQASTFVTAGDSQYSISTTGCVRIGPTFTLSMYMLFSGHLRPENEEDIRQSTWKEIIHKARLKMIRVPLRAVYDPPSEASKSSFGTTTGRNSSGSKYSPNDSGSGLEAETRADEYAYQIIIIEDLDDDRVHTYEDNEALPSAFDDVEVAGVREAIPIHEISKIFYADTGKILNIGGDSESNSPILLLKRDLNAAPPRRMMERFGENQTQDSQDSPEGATNILHRRDQRDDMQALVDNQFDREHQVAAIPAGKLSEPVEVKCSWRIPPNLDPEWMAFEVYTEAQDSDTESEAGSSSNRISMPSRAPSLDPEVISALTKVNLNDGATPNTGGFKQLNEKSTTSSTLHHPTGIVPAIRTSLSLLETILRLLSLQQFQQTSHLSIPDELLNFFLSESATTGAASGDEQERRRLRTDARRRVGFDPYDESPIKRRGEEYQYRGGESQAGWHEGRGNQDNEGVYEDSQSPREAGYEGYSSPIWDSGYDTYITYSPSHRVGSSTRDRQTNNTPLLLKNRSCLSRTSTPDRSLPPLRRSAGSNNYHSRLQSPSIPSEGLFREDTQIATRSGENLGGTATRGSPLSRPETGLEDKGLEKGLVALESLEKG